MWPAGVAPMSPAAVELFVSKEDFKFSAAHFIVHASRRELLHGHNYRVSLSVNGSVGEDGYVVDFGEVKKAMRRICHELDEHFLLPARNPYLTVSEGPGGNVDIVTGDGSRFSLPATDVIRLPICNVSVEELAQHICHRFVAAVTAPELRRHSIVAVTVGVAETANQEARFSVVVSNGSAMTAAGEDGYGARDDDLPLQPRILGPGGATSPRQATAPFGVPPLSGTPLLDAPSDIV